MPSTDWANAYIFASEERYLVLPRWNSENPRRHPFEVWLASWSAPRRTMVVVVALSMVAYGLRTAGFIWITPWDRGRVKEPIDNLPLMAPVATTSVAVRQSTTANSR
jgi:hypothetical protein